MALVYDPPLLPPIPTVQFVVINMPEFYTYLQESNLVELNNVDDEGLHALLLLDSLDMVLWTFMFVMAPTYQNCNLGKLKKRQTKLP